MYVKSHICDTARIDHPCSNFCVLQYETQIQMSWC